jgi:hypothetical protein
VSVSVDLLFSAGGEKMPALQQNSVYRGSIVSRAESASTTFAVSAEVLAAEPVHI